MGPSGSFYIELSGSCDVGLFNWNCKSLKVYVIWITQYRFFCHRNFFASSGVRDDAFMVNRVENESGKHYYTPFSQDKQLSENLQGLVCHPETGSGIFRKKMK